MIVIATQCFPPRLGGIEQLMWDLATGLQAQGEAVSVLADGKKQPSDDAAPFKITRFPQVKWLRKRAKRHALERLFEQPIKALICDTWKSAEYLAQRTRRHGIPVIVLAHGNDVLTQQQPHRSHRLKFAFGHASAVVAVSHFTQQQVLHLGISEQKVHCIHPGAPQSKSTDDASISLPEEREPLLLTLARLEPRKGIDRVLEALPKLLPDFPDLLYVIAGSGDDQSRLESIVKTQQLEKHVQFAGAVNAADKQHLLEQATLFVMPTRHDKKQHSVEGLGLVYLEAAQAALPILASASGGVTDIITQAKTGILCDGNNAHDVAEKLAYCLKHPGEMKKLATAAQNYVAEQFSPSGMIEDFLDLIEELGPSAGSLD